MTITHDNRAEVERAVLAAAITLPEHAVAFYADGRPEWFEVGKHRDTATAIRDLLADGQPVNPTTVGVRVGDLLHTQGLAASAHYVDIGKYLSALHSGWLSREVHRLLTVGARRAERALSGDDDSVDAMDWVQENLSALVLQAQGHYGSAHIEAAVESALKQVDQWEAGETPEYAPSGIYSLDTVTGGYPVGEVTTFAAMTGAGKTAFLTHSARAVALAEAAKVRTGKIKAARPIVIFSAEMNREQLVHRMASAASNANLRELRSGKCSAAVYATYREALLSLAPLPIVIDDNPAPTLAQISARLTQASIGSGGEIAFVAVDYDEKVSTQGASEELRVSAIAQGLKSVAKRHNVAVLALSQYSRKATHNEAPSNDWLRYSGKKEHESAQIIHWSYPGYWTSKGHELETIWGKPISPGDGLLVVTKNRFGPGGKIRLRFLPESTAFVDPDDPETRGPRYAIGHAPPSDSPF